MSTLKSLRYFFSRCLFFLAIIAIAVIMASQLFGRYLWQLELFSHYVPHVALLSLLATAFYPKITKHHRTEDNGGHRKYLPLPRLFLLISTLLLGLWSIQPISLWLPNLSTSEALSSHTLSAKPNSSASTVSIGYQNVNIANQSPEQTLAQLTQSGQSYPDVLALIEAGGSNWQESLQAVTDRYPVHCGHDEFSPFAMQLYAKAQTNNAQENTAKCEIIMLNEAQGGFALARLTLLQNTTSRRLYVIHPPPPINNELAHARNQYLDELATLISHDETDNIMVIGDFNLSAFSPIYRDFIADAQYKGASYEKSRYEGARYEETSYEETGLHRTTINGLPTWLPFGIGIDHVLVSQSEQTSPDNTYFNNRTYTQTHIRNWVGSDHRGFLINWSED